MLKFSFLLLSAGLIIACACGRKATRVKFHNPGQPPPLAAQQIKSNEKMPVIVRFFSIGQGANFAVREEFLKWVNNYPLPKGMATGMEEKRWGREGESDFCFPLPDWGQEQQKKFVSDIRNFLNNKDLVQILENEDCPVRR